MNEKGGKGWIQLALIASIVAVAFSDSPGFGVFFGVLLVLSCVD